MTRSAVCTLILSLTSLLGAQDATFRGQVNVVHQSRRDSGNADVVVWLTPSRTEETVVQGPPARLVQKDKRFSPHVIAVQVGSEIEFPNRDPFFHDVFSIYRGKPFDLGLYESGAVRRIRFSQPGVSYIFCNIHPGMSATVVALRTPHFAITAPDGTFQIARVPPGHYRLEFWYELASDSELRSLSRDLDIPSDISPATITLHSVNTPQGHLNKYGQQYPLEKSRSY